MELDQITRSSRDLLGDESKASTLVANRYDVGLDRTRRCIGVGLSRGEPDGGGDSEERRLGEKHFCGCVGEN